MHYSTVTLVHSASLYITPPWLYFTQLYKPARCDYSECKLSSHFHCSIQQRKIFGRLVWAYLKFMRLVIDCCCVFVLLSCLCWMYVLSDAGLLLSYKSQKVFWRKTSACRDGSLKNPTKLDGNDTTLSHHSYILCHFAATYTNMLCVCCVQKKGCGRQWGGWWWVCSVFWCAWRVSYGEKNVWVMMV